MVGGISVSSTSLVSVSSPCVSSSCAGAGGVREEYAGPTSRGTDDVCACLDKDRPVAARNVDPHLYADRRSDPGFRLSEGSGESAENGGEWSEETPLFPTVGGMDEEGVMGQRSESTPRSQMRDDDEERRCPPSYSEAVGSDGDPGYGGAFPPSYESLFHGDGIVRIVCNDAGPERRIEVRSTEREVYPRHIRGPVFPEEIDRQSVLDALDREFRWTAISVGLSVVLLFVFVLVIVLVVAPYNRQQVTQ